MLVIVFTLLSISNVFAVPRYPSLLELSARPWLYELSKKHGRTIATLSQVPDAEIQAIAKKGYNIVWLMGVWALGPYGLNFDRTNADAKKNYDKHLPGWTKDDVIGSPYAITNYTVNPQLGTMTDLKNFKDRLSRLGVQLYLDLVPNHSATDMSLVASKPQLFIRAPPNVKPPYDSNVYLPNGVAYGKDPYSGAWKDTAQYNLWEPQMRTQLMAFLEAAAQVSDGVRCDMAMLLINDVIKQTWGSQLSAWGYSQPATEFWKTATAETKKKHPNFAFLAEVYWGREQQLLGMGFDYMYDKDGLYNRLSSGNLDNLRGYIRGTDLSKMCHFTENHDEDRAIAHFGSVARANAAAVVSMTLPGMRFYFQGQMEGKQGKLVVHLRRSRDEPVKQDVVAFYDKLHASLNHTVFHSGTWSYVTITDTEGTSWRLLAWKWKEGKEKRLCIINYSDAQGSGRIVLPDAAEKASGSTVTLKDEMTGQSYQRDVNELKNQGLFVTLGAWQYHIFNY